MLDIVQISQWGVDELQQKCRGLLEPQESLNLTTSGIGIDLKLLGLKGAEVYRHESLDLKECLLTTYCWLYTRKHPPTSWVSQAPKASRYQAPIPTTQKQTPQEIDLPHHDVWQIYRDRLGF